MTREEIEVMPAGREMDTLVADLLDWPVHATKKGDWYFKEIRRYCRRYSTDISAAWEVVESINRMICLTVLPEAKVCQASIIDCVPVLTVEADTAPLAICRASLLAVMR